MLLIILQQKILGKNTGDDFKEGKITLPIILAYGRSNDKEKSFGKEQYLILTKMMVILKWH